MHCEGTLGRGYAHPIFHNQGLLFFFSSFFLKAGFHIPQTGLKLTVEESNHDFLNLCTWLALKHRTSSGLIAQLAFFFLSLFCSFFSLLPLPPSFLLFLLCLPALSTVTWALIRRSSSLISESSRPAWSIKQVPGQPGLHRKTLPRKTKIYSQTCLCANLIDVFLN